VDGGEVFLQQRFARDGARFAAVGLREAMHDSLELVGPHVFGGRVDQVAHQQAGLELRVVLREAFGREVERQARGRARRFAVAIELVAAEAPRQQGVARLDLQPLLACQAVCAFG
jgi:hypothetical protein